MPSHSAESLKQRRPWWIWLLAGVLVTVLVAGFVVLKTTTLFGDPTASSAPPTETAPPPSPSTESAPAPAAPAPGAPAPAPEAGNLQADFETFNKTITAPIGIVVLPIGGGTPTSLGLWTSGSAWSTSKVPLSIAALRANPSVSGTAASAITESDNASAEALWSGLGEPAVAKTKVEAVLQQAGDPTSVESERTAGPEFSAFGQTQWSLENQARFMAFAACSPDPVTKQVLGLMGQIAGDQSWGLGTIDGTRFKGGWGPNSGGYLVRQLGIIDQGGKLTAVAIATQSSSFGQGTSDLNAIAKFLKDHLAELPTGTCGPA